MAFFVAFMGLVGSGNAYLWLDVPIRRGTLSMVLQYGEGLKLKSYMVVTRRMLVSGFDGLEMTSAKVWLGMYNVHDN